MKNRLLYSLAFVSFWILVVAIFTACSNASDDVLRKEDAKNNLLFINEAYLEGVSYIIRGNDVAFRGTMTTEELISDINITKQYDDKCDCYVHQGFRYEALKHYNELLNLLDKEKLVTLSGHSLGGAKALLLGLWLIEDGYDVEIFTYGQPRVLTWVAATRYADLPVWRYTCENDPIPRMPPWLAGYMHVGDHIQLGDESLLQIHEVNDHHVRCYFKHLNKED